MELLDKTIESHQIKLDQQYTLHDQERQQLNDKTESLSANISALERAKITLENQNSSLNSQMAAKEKMANEMREEFENDKLEQAKKHDDTK
jgi:predicted  nucleic acid-binding Zn-ribbon protein